MKGALRVPVRMLRALVRLTIRLARETELRQLSAYSVGTDRVAHGC
jgi:hypothetical protein